MHFLQELVQDYLILAHPEVELPRIEMADEATPGEKEEDSFLPQIEHAEEITHGDKEEISTGKPAPVEFPSLFY